MAAACRAIRWWVMLINTHIKDVLYNFGGLHERAWHEQRSTVGFFGAVGRS